MLGEIKTLEEREKKMAAIKGKATPSQSDGIIVSKAFMSFFP